MGQRDLDLPDLDAVVAEMRRLRDGGYTRLGTWSLGQSCHHCAVPIEQSVDGFTFGASAPVRLIIRLMGIKNRILRQRRIKPGVKGPGATMPPDEADDGEQVERFESAVKRFRAHGGPYQTHPFFGPMTTDEWEQFLTVHTVHHLRFLKPEAE